MNILSTSVVCNVSPSCTAQLALSCFLAAAMATTTYIGARVGGCVGGGGCSLFIYACAHSYLSTSNTNPLYRVHTPQQGK